MVLSLGRSNPSKIFDNIVSIKGLFDERVFEVNENDLVYESVSPKLPSVVDQDHQESSLTSHRRDLSRFRHASCFLPNTSKIFVYGGKHYDEATLTSSVLNDAYLIDQLSGQTQSIKVIMRFLKQIRKENFNIYIKRVSLFKD